MNSNPFGNLEINKHQCNNINVTQSCESGLFCRLTFLKALIYINACSINIIKSQTS